MIEIITKRSHPKYAEFNNLEYSLWQGYYNLYSNDKLNKLRNEIDEDVKKSISKIKVGETFIRKNEQYVITLFERKHILEIASETNPMLIRYIRCVNNIYSYSYDHFLINVMRTMYLEEFLNIYD